MDQFPGTAAHQEVTKSHLGFTGPGRNLVGFYRKLIALQPSTGAIGGVMQSREEVVARVRKKIRLLHYALSTEDSYCSWVARYYTYCLTLPATWSPEQKAEEYLSYLARERRISARSQDQAFASILFLYKEVLGRPLEKVDPLRAKRPSQQRVAPSRE